MPERLEQAAVIPVRRRQKRVEICLIRRRRSTNWSIPKGFIDAGHTPQDAALIEAYEEAGLRGEVMGGSIGTYDYEKRGSRFTVVVYVMQVRSELEEWQEMWLRERRWCSLKKATSLLADHPVHPLLKRVRAVPRQRPEAN